MLSRKRVVVVAVAITLIPIAAIAWWLGSPLLFDKTVEEEFPFSFTATVPDDMSRGDVEKVMEVMSKVEQQAEDPMPDKMDMPKGAGGEVPGASAAKISAMKLKTGSFRDADSSHRGSGQATIYRAPDGSYLLRLENLNVTNGPALHVFLTPHESPEDRNDVKVPGHADLGKLKGNMGNQNYDIPGDVNVADQYSVVIYCKPFNIIFSVASLQDVGEVLRPPS